MDAVTVAAAAEVIERLARGESAASILASLRPAGERELLRRAAVVRTFDRDLFDRVLAADAAGLDLPAFDEFVRVREVEALPRSPDVFQLRQEARSEHWRAWWDEAGASPAEIPKALGRLLGRLVAYYGKTGNRVDLLAQLALVDHEKAEALFRELYREADARFDLAGCQDLIDVLSDPVRAPFLGKELTAARNDRTTYLRARSLWSAEFHRTETFVEPKNTLAVYEKLMDAKRRRVLNLHAPGGRGKTTQLRWLIARNLVPERAWPEGHPFGDGRIPCARVDFDLVDPITATKYAWLVLLEVAAQLNQQLPKAPFNELLEEYGWATPLIPRNPHDSSRVGAASRRITNQAGDAAGPVVRRFGRTLNDSAGDAPVVLVFDTLEEVHIRPRGDLVNLIRLLRQVLDGCPGVRLILSGRTSVAEILKKVADELPAMREVKVPFLSRREADLYLADRRGLEDAEVRRAIVAKAGEHPGVEDSRGSDPFVLSLLADEVQARPGLTPKEIRSYPADAIRLIRRVVDRIEEPGVQWLLRYGVVPRALTLSFVRDVMEPYLRDGMSGGEGDDPGRDPVPPDVGDGESRYRKVLASPDDPLDLDAIWKQLRRYAGSTAWVFEIPGDEETFRFRGDVVVPMRRLIRDQRFYPSLHEDAAEYYERKAAKDPERWAQWTCEVLYHRFQLKGSAAGPAWREALERAGAARARLPGRARAAAAVGRRAVDPRQAHARPGTLRARVRAHRACAPGPCGPRRRALAPRRAEPHLGGRGAEGTSSARDSGRRPGVPQRGGGAQRGTSGPG
jgi:cellulose synthase operon protein C